MKQEQVKNRTVLITGASSGIGKSTGQLLAEKGFRVFGTSRQERPDVDGIEMVKLNVHSDKSVKHCVELVLERSDHIDVLVNNAGFLDEGFAEEMSMEDARSIFETNFFGVVRMTNAVLPSMRDYRQGRIINVGSLAGCIAVPGQAFYSASKHALSGYSEALRQEVWPLGIHVSLVEPGFVKTNLHRTASKHETTISSYKASQQAVFEAINEKTEQGIEAIEIAQLILKIANTQSPRLRYRPQGEAFWLPRLKSFLPQRIFEWGLRRSFGLQKNKNEVKDEQTNRTNHDR